MIRNSEYKKLREGLHIELFQSVNEINPQEWNAVQQNRNVFLSIPYLQALEQTLSENISFRYVLVYSQDKKPIALFYFQQVRFIDKGIAEEDAFCKLHSFIRKGIYGKTGLKVLTCGNVFSCGENGFMHTEMLSRKNLFELLPYLIRMVQKLEKEDNKSSLLMVKELWPEPSSASDSLKKEEYLPFFVDVNMVMKILPTWNSMEDYLDSMITKFRTKAKGTFNKSSPLVIQSLNADEIQKHSIEIETLYYSVLNKSSFRFGILSSNTFVELKRNLKEDFIFKAYFLDGKLSGFSTAFVYANVMEANFVGLDYKVNKKHCIYQRMLYDFVEIAIRRKCLELRLGRTAEEIKSSIGASPISMKLYVRHRNHISTNLIKPIVRNIKPANFELRRPYKKVIVLTKKKPSHLTARFHSN